MYGARVAQVYQVDERNETQHRIGRMTYKVKLPDQEFPLKVDCSTKVFIGRIDHVSTSYEDIRNYFSYFGEIQRIQGKIMKKKIFECPFVHCFIEFNSKENVQNLLKAHWLPERRQFLAKITGHPKEMEVEIVPWVESESIYQRGDIPPGFLQYSISLRYVPENLTARQLAEVMNTFSDGNGGHTNNVALCIRSIDASNYPTGRARVIFNNLESYRKAVEGSKKLKIEILGDTYTWRRKIQIDPFIESLCPQGCSGGPRVKILVCRQESRKFCTVCWKLKHNTAKKQGHSFQDADVKQE